MAVAQLKRGGITRALTHACSLQFMNRGMEFKSLPAPRLLGHVAPDPIFTESVGLRQITLPLILLTDSFLGRYI